MTKLGLGCTTVIRNSDCSTSADTLTLGLRKQSGAPKRAEF